jgi:hypothetical protein
MERAGEGCGFSMNDVGTGGKKVLALFGENSPFGFRRIHRDPVTGRGNGRAVRARVSSSRLKDTIEVNCWVPADMSFAELTDRLIVAQTKGVWKGAEIALRQAPTIPATTLSRPLSKEAAAFKEEMLLKNPPSMTADIPTTSARRSVTFWCEGYVERKANLPPATFSFDIRCTCQSTNGGVTWSCVMNFENFSIDFEEDEYAWDFWTDCDEVGCGGGGGTETNLTISPNSVDAYEGQTLTFSAQINGALAGWWWDGNDGSSYDMGCATLSCSITPASSGAMTVYGPNLMSASADVNLLPTCTESYDEDMAAQLNSPSYDGNLSGLIDCADQSFQEGRPHLPPAGALWRRIICDSATGAASNVCMTAFERFWLKTDSCSDMVLSGSEFIDLKAAITSRISTLSNVTTGSFPNGGTRKGTVSLYTTPYTTTLGTVTVYLDASDNVVGFYDEYNWNLDVDRSFKYQVGIAALIMSLPHDGSGAYMTCPPSTGFVMRYP